MSDDLAFAGALEVAARMRARSLSPVEYVEALLARIDRHDGDLHAFLLVDREAALAAARAAEAAIGRGAGLGPLHGVAFALKDIIDRAGLPTTAHSRILRDNVAREDAEVTRRLDAAGAIHLGKTATHEFAIGGPSFDLPWPPARNPWDRARFTGGSSSGSGAALAAGLVPLALGTDTGGSVRHPATHCGIVGMKATYGRVSRRGVFPLSFSLDYVGPMTRGVADNAALLGVLAGHDAADPASARVAVPDFAAGLEVGIAGLRVGVMRRFYARDMEATPEVADALEAAIDVLAGLGARVVEIDPGPLADYADCNRVILVSEAFAVHERWLCERPGDYGALARERISTGAFLRAVDYVQATRARTRLVARMREAMRDVDVAVTASSMDPPGLIEDAAEMARTYARQARAPFNVTGFPALAMPCGFSAGGLPIGWQIAGHPFDEATVYRVARAYERATPWKDRRPPLG